MSEYMGKDTFKLGFGLMRLPKNADGSINHEEVSEMADRFIAAGGTYFDTAYVYDGGKSEEAFRKCVAERYPRDAYTICTKLCAWMHCHDEESAKQQFWTSLERCGAGYFDYYLLHALQRNNYTKYDEYHIWDFIQEQKEKGLVKHWGFSFHADPELLEELLNAHPEVDFVQLQINYADWDNPGVASRECLEICQRHNKPVTVMEPIKGGKLASPSADVREIFDAYDANRSYASWAIRFAASQDYIITVLSGMSNLAQMDDNLSYMKDFKPLNDEEDRVIKRVQAVLSQDQSIKCTACHYCTDGCPMSIPIPEIFSAANKARQGNKAEAQNDYDAAVEGRGRASGCIQCGQCEGACPQHLPIITYLEQARDFD